jgi:cyanophycin synthetase
MELLSVQALHGPNVWGKLSMLEAAIDLRAWQHLGPAEISAFQDRLRACLPSLATRRAAVRCVAHPGSLQNTLSEALRDVALELQTLVSVPVGLGAIGGIEESGRCHVAVQFEEEKLGRACLHSSCEICVASLGAQPFDMAAELRRLRALAEDVCLGRATGPLVAAARDRGIPFRRLDEVSLVQLGYGSQQRRIQTSVTDRTSKLAESISLDKELTQRLLREVGLPVPVGRPVASAEDAWAAACELGTPVVIKPRNADYGHGIGLNLTKREQIVAAYAAAREYREEVLVQRFARGEQYRITVVDNRMIAAVRRDPVRVTGDSKHKLSELIEEANLDPRRGDDLRLPLTRICPDDDTPQMLAEQGVDFDTVLPRGVEIVLSRIGHSWAGAGVTDITDLVHPQVAAQCIRAVRLIGLDVAGIDVIAQDISRPLEDQGGVIVEVNAEPTIAFHFPPLCDRYRPVCEAVIASMFPDGRTGRIPVAVIAGHGNTSCTGRWLAELLAVTGQGIGRASSEGLYVDGERWKPGDQANRAGSLAVLLCPQVGAAVLERELGSIRQEGLGLDQIDVAILSALEPDHGDQTPRDPDFLRAARVLVEAAAPNGTVVIDASDSAAAALAGTFPGTVIMVESRSDCPMVSAGRGAAYCSIHLRNGHMVLSSGDGTEQVFPVDEALVSAADGRGRQSALLAAVAAAWAMNRPLDAIRIWLKSRSSDGLRVKV